MIIDNLNLNHLRIFQAVYRTGSMTSAARDLHLTQSGVSQHVKSFEDVLGVKLFDRIKQKLVPTGAAAMLYRECTNGLNGIERALNDIKGVGQELAGTVVIGMPIEFGNSLLLPLIAAFSKKHPRVRFKLRMGFASSMNEEIIKGRMDFAFVDEFSMDRRVVVEKVFDETLDLCASPEYLKKKAPPKHNRKFYESLEYVEYQDEEPILRMWFAHHLGTKHLTLDVKTVVMDVQGVARLIMSGLGAGVLPHHLVVKLQKENSKLFRFKGCGKSLKNSISVAYLPDRSHSAAVSAALGFLRDSLLKTPFD